MASQNDQVIINFGPARYDSPKAIRNQIEAAQQETQESTVAQITNDPNIDLGGGGAAAISDVSVDVYDPVTKIGTGTDPDGVEYEFTNGTGVYLVPDDVVVLVDGGDEEYFAVGITERSGETTPIDQPIAVIDPSFPLNIGTLTLPIRTDGGNPTTASQNGAMTSGHDLAGEFGQGVDLVFGQNGATSPTAVNAFCRDNSANSSLFPTSPSTPGVFYLQPGSGGRIINYNTSRQGLYYRLPGDLSWTAGPTTLSPRWAIDQETGWVWGVTQSSTTPFTHTVYRFAPTDAAPVNMGSMNIPLTNGSSLDPWIAAGNGYLTVSSVVPGFPSLRLYCVKPSADSTNFTQLGTFAIASWDPTAVGSPATNAQVSRLQVDSNGGTSYMMVTASTLRIRSLAQSLVITDYDTGIPAQDHGFNHKHLQSGLVGIVASVVTTTFGDPNLGRYTAVLATYNYSSTSYQYYDISIFATGGLLPRFGAPQEVSAGVVRYTYGSSATTSNWLVELSGL